MHVLHTHWAILFKCPQNAFVIFQAFQPYTSLACVAMERFFSPSNSANSTFVAVVEFFRFLIVFIQVADIAEIAAEFNIAIITVLFWRLHMITIETFDFGDVVSSHLMIFLWVLLVVIMDFIMT